MNDSSTQLQVREALKEILRTAPSRGFTHAKIARQAGFSPGAVSSWANGNSDIDLWRFVQLCAILPDDLTSIVFEDIGKALRSVEGAGCFDELAAATAAYAVEHISARNDNSPGGSAIVHSEALSLVKRARAIRDCADRVISQHGGVGQ